MSDTRKNCYSHPSDRNVGNKCGYADNLGGNAEKTENQCGDSGTQGGNLV